jgi:hypothetical protein
MGTHLFGGCTVTENQAKRRMPRVTVELDSGPCELMFCYLPLGVPAYGDVPSRLDVCADEQKALLAGALMVQVGNWHSFVVEKRYYDVSHNGGTGT